MAGPTTEERERIRGYLQAQAAKLSPAELADKIRADMEQVRAAIDAVPAERFDHAPPGEWSANTICSHLVHTSDDVARGIIAVLDSGAQPQPVADQLGAEGSGIRAGAEWWQSLLAGREALLTRVRAATGDEHLDITWEHPFFGQLNWREWVLFTRIHDIDHARQLQSLAEH